MKILREWIYACLDANHLLCSASLLVFTLVIGLPFIIVEQLLQGALVLVRKDSEDGD